MDERMDKNLPYFVGGNLATLGVNPLSWADRLYQPASPENTDANSRGQSTSLPIDLISPKGQTSTTLKGKDITFIAFNIRSHNSYIIQEAQLSPRDRAMRRVNWNLANCHATVQKLLLRQVLTKSMVWSWRFSRRQCVIDNVHSTMTRRSRFHCLRCVINTLTTDDLWISPVYRRLAVAKFSESTM